MLRSSSARSGSRPGSRSSPTSGGRNSSSSRRRGSRSPCARWCPHWSAAVRFTSARSTSTAAARSQPIAAPSSSTTSCAFPGPSTRWPGRLRPPAAGRAWDLTVAYGFRPGPVLEALDTVAFADHVREARLRPSYYVDLEQLRAAGRSYDDALSRNKRWQIRKFARMYEPLGPLAVEVARDAGHAEALLGELIALHERSWMARGRRGAFASSRKLAFHRTLIRRAFAAGAIQLIRVTAGPHTVGILYNFVRDGRIDFYQSGLAYQEGFRPGYVTFATALRYYLDHGDRQFDFLAGEQQYKQSLSTSVRELVWVVYRRGTLRMRAIEGLQRGRDAIMRSLGRGTPSAVAPDLE